MGSIKNMLYNIKQRENINSYTWKSQIINMIQKLHKKHSIVKNSLLRFPVFRE